MPSYFDDYPGYYFLAATLLPLASFFLIFLASGAWGLLRPYRERPLGAALFRLFGGDRPGPLPAYVALGAIALAFACSLAGAIKYQNDLTKHEHVRRDLEGKLEGLRPRIKGTQAALAEAKK